MTLPRFAFAKTETPFRDRGPMVRILLPPSGESATNRAVAWKLLRAEPVEHLVLWLMPITGVRVFKREPPELILTANVSRPGTERPTTR